MITKGKGKEVEKERDVEKGKTQMGEEIIPRYHQNVWVYKNKQVLGGIKGRIKAIAAN